MFGSDGSNGKDGGQGITKWGQFYSLPGEVGNDGKTPFYVGGDLTFIIYSPIKVHGGNGGNGGNGADEHVGITVGDGADGGNGGNGAPAVVCGGTVKLFGNTNLATFKGGSGGLPGIGGYDKSGNIKASDGKPGVDGESGIE